jgi:hypothetical protein
LAIFLAGAAVDLAGAGLAAVAGFLAAAALFLRAAYCLSIMAASLAGSTFLAGSGMSSSLDSSSKAWAPAPFEASIYTPSSLFTVSLSFSSNTCNKSLDTSEYIIRS